MSVLTLLQQDLLSALLNYEKQPNLTVQRANEVGSLRKIIINATYAYDLWFTITDRVEQIEGSPIAKIFPCLESSRLILGLRAVLEDPQYQPPLLLRIKQNQLEQELQPIGLTVTEEQPSIQVTDGQLSDLEKRFEQYQTETAITISTLKQDNKTFRHQCKAMIKDNEALKSILETQRLQLLDHQGQLEKLEGKLEKKRIKIQRLREKNDKLKNTAHQKNSSTHANNHQQTPQFYQPV